MNPRGAGLVYQVFLIALILSCFLDIVKPFSKKISSFFDRFFVSPKVYDVRQSPRDAARGFGLIFVYRLFVVPGGG